MWRLFCRGVQCGALLLSLGSLLPAWAAPGLKPYRDDAELNAALQRWRSESQQLQAQRARPMALGAQANASSLSAPAAAMKAADAAAPSPSAAQESITNIQTVGVDEGGIVKRAGDYLVVLRRGRLFTVRVGGGALEPAAHVDAYAPGTDPRGAWYDELLISGRTVVVVGYSYARGGTEIGLFDLGEAGSLTWRATYHLRSFDYYSERNYASRLVGQQLVFYTPTVLQPWGAAAPDFMPAVRRWGGAGLPSTFERILPPTRIYRSDDDFEPGHPIALHTVTRCDLAASPMRCEASAVLAPAGRVFYVSAGSVFVWTQGRSRATGAAGERPAEVQAAVFRLPLDGATPTALKAVGAPVDAQSFLEDEQGHLNVLLREFGAGEAFWSSRRGGGRMALLRVPLAAFGDGSTAAAREHYQRLPGTPQGGLQNRYVGPWLLWGAGEEAWALRYAIGAPAQALAPGHAVERIEALGGHAVLVGNRGADLSFSAVRLSAANARLESRLVQPGARQAESRTHGFFYRPQGREDGLLGLPALRGSQGAAVVVVRQRGLVFTSLGELASRRGVRQDDGCKASCVDWYGNARPIFLGERVLALMGYELVEGQVQADDLQERLVEVQRLDLSPAPAGRRGQRPTPFD